MQSLCCFTLCDDDAFYEGGHCVFPPNARAAYRMFCVTFVFVVYLSVEAAVEGFYLQEVGVDLSLSLHGSVNYSRASGQQ